MPTFETGLSVTFHAAHSLTGNFGPACEVHDHDYRVDVTVFGEHLTNESVLVDIVPLQESIRSVVARWDNQNLDTQPELNGINTTMEALARYLHRRVGTAMPQHRDLTVEVKVWETPTAWGAYRGPINVKSPDAATIATSGD
jgi:6-pyruvoyl-tetrahydropterin synthase